MSADRLTLAFAGTPELAAIILQDILDQGEHDVTCIYTRPDRPAGRGRKLQPGPVKRLALQTGIETRQPATAAELAGDQRIPFVDVLVVVAYGMILPEPVLQGPQRGCINIHTSLLPRWRGAAPIQRAIQHGDSETGISIMQMDNGIDTGPVLLQRPCPIDSSDTAGSLHDKLAVLGSECIRTVLGQIARGEQQAVAQDDNTASYAGKISKQEAKIDWGRSAAELERMIRAFNPVPVAWTTLGENSVRVWAARLLPVTTGQYRPGSIIAYNSTGLDIACGDNLLRITDLQLQGRKRQAIRDFHNGHPGLFLPV